MSLGPTEVISAFGLFGAGVAFVVGLLQYLRAQRWKRAEWVSQEMDTFFADPNVRAALQMIGSGV